MGDDSDTMAHQMATVTTTLMMKMLTNETSPSPSPSPSSNTVFATNGTFHEIGLATLFNLAIGGGILLLFEVLRVHNKRVYSLRHRSVYADRCPSLPSTVPFGWVMGDKHQSHARAGRGGVADDAGGASRLRGRLSAMFSSRGNGVSAEESLLESVGLDNYVLLQVLNVCFSFCVFGCVVGLCVLIPVFHHGGGGRRDIQSYSIANVGEDNIGYLWAPVACAYIYALHFLRISQNLVKDFSARRQRWLMEGDPNVERQSAFTVMVENIPRAFQTDLMLRVFYEKLFPGKVHSASVLRDVAELVALCRKRMTVVDKLERALLRRDARGKAQIHRKLSLADGGCISVDTIMEQEMKLSELNAAVDGTQRRVIGEAKAEEEIVRHRLISGLGNGGATMRSAGLRGEGMVVMEEAGDNAALGGRGSLHTSLLSRSSISSDSGRPTNDAGAGSELDNPAAAAAAAMAATASGSVGKTGEDTNGDKGKRGGVGDVEHGMAASRADGAAKEHGGETTNGQDKGMAGVEHLKVPQRSNAKSDVRDRAETDASSNSDLKVALDTLTTIPLSAVTTLTSEAFSNARELGQAALNLGSDVVSQFGMVVGVDGGRTSTGFVTFHDRASVAMATQMALSSEPHAFRTRLAPEPRDILWGNVIKPRKLVKLRGRIVTGLSTLGSLGWYTVVVTIVAISNLDNLEKSLPFLKDINHNGPFYSLLGAYLSVILLLLALMVLPIVLKWVAQRYERRKTLSEVQISVTRRIFYYQVANVYVIVTASSIFAVLEAGFHSPVDAIKKLGLSLPSAGPYFAQFLITKVLLGIPLELLRLGPTMMFILHHVGGQLRTPRQERVELHESTDIEFEKVYPAILLNLLICAGYQLISPLIIMPVGAIYFGVYRLVLKYQMKHIFVPRYETGGKFFYVVFPRMLVAVGCSYVLLICHLMAHGAWRQATVVSPLVLLVIIFYREMDKAYLTPGKSLTLDLVRQADADGDTDSSRDFKQTCYRQPHIYEPHVGPEKHGWVASPSTRRGGGGGHRGGRSRVGGPLGASGIDDVAQTGDEGRDVGVESQDKMIVELPSGELRQVSEL